MSFYSGISDHILHEPLTNHCIILDLDETLVHASEKMDFFFRSGILTDSKLIDIRERSYVISIDDVVERRGTGSKTHLWAMTRPYLKEFLIFCFNYFKVVAVWSAGRNRYVHKTVEAIFKDVATPHVIYTRDDCEENNRDLFKPLRKMIQNEPGLNNYMSLTNTFALDDRESTYSRNPGSGILIPPYEPNANLNDLRIKDNALLQLMNWLKQDHVMKSNDISKLDKTLIFTQPLNANPSNVPSIYNSSLISNSLFTSNLEDSDSKTKKIVKPNPLPKSLFLPSRCIEENGKIKCDPRLKNADILLSSDEIRRDVTSIESQFIAFSPSRSPRRENSGYNLRSPHIELKIPKSPRGVYNPQKASDDEFKPPDSPTFTPKSDASDSIKSEVNSRIPMYRRRTDVTESNLYPTVSIYS